MKLYNFMFDRAGILGHALTSFGIFLKIYIFVKWLVCACVAVGGG